MTEPNEEKCWFYPGHPAEVMLAYKETPDRPFLPVCRDCAEKYTSEFVIA